MWNLPEVSGIVGTIWRLCDEEVKTFPRDCIDTPEWLLVFHPKRLPEPNNEYFPLESWDKEKMSPQVVGGKSRETQ